MRVGALIISHYLSTRFIGKCIAPIGGVPILGRIIQHFNRFKPNLIQEVVACIPDTKEDDLLELIAKEYGGDVFRGEPIDVGKRVLDCMDTYDLTHAIHANGDSWWYDGRLTKEILTNFWASPGYDYFYGKAPEYKSLGPYHEYVFGIFSRRFTEVGWKQTKSAKESQEQFKKAAEEAKNRGELTENYFPYPDWIITQLLHAGLKMSVDYPAEMAFWNKMISLHGYPETYQDLTNMMKEVRQL
jgi:spore coat polysaccharide biosynthesis protein SpsF (cytidylyltransferase family)